MHVVKCIYELLLLICISNNILIHSILDYSADNKYSLGLYPKNVKTYIEMEKIRHTLITVQTYLLQGAHNYKPLPNPLQTEQGRDQLPYQLLKRPGQWLARTLSYQTLYKIIITLEM